MNYHQFKTAEGIQHHLDDLEYLIESIKKIEKVESMTISLNVSRDGITSKFTKKTVGVNSLPFRKIQQAIECSIRLLQKEFDNL